MDVVDTWTGARASALQRALRLTNERYADRLGTAVRTVAKWNANPALEPSAEMQEALDTLLRTAPEHVKTRYAMLSGEWTQHDEASESSAVLDNQRLLSKNVNLAVAAGWLDNAAGWAPGAARGLAATELVRMDPMWLIDRGQRRARVNQRDVAAALSRFYSSDQQRYGTYSARVDSATEVATSVLTCREWLDLGCSLMGPGGNMRLVRERPLHAARVTEDVATGAMRRLAEAHVVGSQLVDAPTYRLNDIAIGPGRLGGSFSMTTFVEYALTMDLLEGELIDALAEGRAVEPGTLPLRDSLLPDLTSVVDVGNRVCVGGALALCAIARSRAGSSRTNDDYVILVQERSGRVLNASSRLAVIPKSFHQPLTDFEGDVQIGATLRREMEEELFGRVDLDGTLGNIRHADPMHRSRLSDPMRWLTDNATTEQWRMEATAFGLNLVSGNCEFAGLVVIHDPEFWELYGGHIEANWESEGLRQYSTLDRSGLLDLITDPTWSNEGLFALLQGLRRLGKLDSGRVDLPAIEWNVTA